VRGASDAQSAAPARVTARGYKYFDLVMVAFVVVLLLSNTVAVKVMRLGPFSIGPVTLGPWATDGATLLFPISYIFGDVLTEVYGYARSRRVIWAGFAANAFMAGLYAFVGWMPPAADWSGQDAYMAILGQTPRIVLASLVAFWAGEFCNSYVLARLKILTRGRWLWTRTLGSTVVGQAIDTTLFVLIAFWGVVDVWALIRFGFVFKVLYETLATPATYAIVNALKRAEHEDYFDVGTDFNPFAVTVADRRELPQPRASA
jgi:queuosine precursor transporter